MYYFQNFSDCNVECKHGKHKTAFRARKLYSVVFSRNGPQILLVKKLLEPIRRPTLIWVVTRHQYGISALVSQTSFPAGNQWWRPEMSAVLPDTTRVAFITNIKIGTRLNKRIGLLVSMIFTESNKRTISV